MKRFFTLFFVSAMVSAVMAWDALYIVGGGTKQAGWDDERIPMVKISETEFEYSGYFYKTNIGEGGSGEGWKIAKYDDNGNWDCYHPAGGWAKCERGNEFTMTDDDEVDNKFWVDESGFYTINLKTDINKLTISNSDKPKYLIPVGDGCATGWNNRSDNRFVETSEGSGKYTGTLELTPTNGHDLKFLCQPVYTAYVGTKSDADGEHDITGTGVFDAKSYVQSLDGDHKYYVLNEAAGTYNMMVDINDGKVYIVPQEITIKANVTKEAVAALGSVKCCAWTGIGSEAKDMTLEGGFYTATFSTYMPLSFLIYNGKFNNEDGGVQTVDMSNDGNGYYEDKCVNVISRRTNDNKLMCFHNDYCQLNSNSVTVNIYVEDAGWEDVYFFTQNAGDQSEYQNVFVHATKGADNWYSYTYEGVDAFTWVATATTTNWDTQVNDIDNVNADKYFYVSTYKHDNGHNKIVSLTGKGQMQDRTLEFKFDGTAATSWGNSPVGLYYWQNYAFEGEEAGDHAAGIEMSKGEGNVYSATVLAFNNVKFVVQSDLSEYHGSGHYTVNDNAQEESEGFAESKKFWIKDNGSGHYLEQTENFDFTPAEMTVTLNKDGFASFFWDKNYELVGAEAYVAHVSGDAVVLSKIEGNGIIPANSAVILYNAAGGEATATETLDAATGYDYTNTLRGATSATTPAGSYYVLAEYQEQTCFVKISGREIPANRAYLPEPAGAPARLRVVFAENTTTGVGDVDVNADVNVKKVLRGGQLYIVRDNKEYDVIGRVGK